MPKVSFRAAFPAIQSAIKVGSDGMRLTLDVPESDLEDAVALLALRDQVLRVTVEVIPYGKKETRDRLLGS
ncbi:MAG: hypothetical protein QF704_00060 [Anaerolineales bacterium]|jgi:hypothetical protein|nr:hypothetical protein [Anaerolineales bacterium]